MDNLTISAASGMRARLESLEMLANNLANAATSGYKSDREFYSLYVAPEAAEPGATTLPVIESRWTDFRQGTLTPTGSPLDCALSGRGFFCVNGPKGILYTRNGSFQLSAAGALVTGDGYAVRDTAGNSIQTVSTAPLEIARDGTVRQSGQVLGQLAIADFDQPNGLLKAGSTYFRAQDAAMAKPAPDAEVHQGKLEASNVAAPESAVRLVSLLRQFEMLQKAIALGGDINRKAVEEVARV